MKFFTRTLCEYVQSIEAPEMLWEPAIKSYDEHLRQIKPMLPPRMGELADNTLHDSVVLDVTRPTASTCAIQLDARQSTGRYRGLVRLTFLGVRAVTVTNVLVGDYWLYEEVHLHPSAAFEYAVLLFRSELSIVADDVEVVEIPAREI